MIRSNETPKQYNTGVILFTDLVNSTEKINLLGDNDYYENVIIQHNNILNKYISESTGRIIKTIGDAYLAVFVTEVEALKCCISAQNEFSELNKLRQNDLQIHVRMALHYGEYTLENKSNDYIDIYGQSINYAARVVSIASGGTVTVSSDFKKKWEKDTINFITMHLNKLIQENEKSTSTVPKETRNKWISQQKTLLEWVKTIKFKSSGYYSFKGFKDDQQVFTCQPSF